MKTKKKRYLKAVREARRVYRYLKHRYSIGKYVYKINVYDIEDPLKTNFTVIVCNKDKEVGMTVLPVENQKSFKGFLKAVSDGIIEI